MITPLIILTILILPYIAFRLISGEEAGKTGAVIGLSIAFMFFATGHFIKTTEMVQMLPPFVPFRTALVYLTGVIELALAVLLLVPQTRRFAGVLCIITFVIFFPANIYGAINHVGTGGHSWGPVYLLIRVPLQIILIGWTYWFVVRNNGK